MKNLKITLRKLSEIKEYANNARKIEKRAIDYVASAIRQYGFLQPLVIDKGGTIVCGHVRFRAAQKLGFDFVPCVVADDLTDAQIKAFRLADNKVATFAIWDAEKLKEEFKAMASEMFSQENLGFSDMVLGAGETPLVSDDDAEGESASAEIDIGSFADETFDYTCPHCGFKF